MSNIRTSRHSGGVLRGGSMRRQTFWIGGTEVVTTNAAASGATLLTSLNAAALALRPFTVVRTRGLLAARSDQTGAAEFYSIAFGLIVVSEEAVAAGVGSVPTPDAQNSSDWYVYERIANQFGFVSGTGILLSMTERIIDSRAMRKVSEGQQLISVQEVSATSGGGVTMSSFARTLIKLH